MITALIRWSVANRFLVVLASALLAVAGVWAVKTTPLDAIPDLSDTQVIIRTTFPGQAPQIVEDQVTYPLTTTMLSVPGAKTVRGYSFFGDSFVYVLFDDGTDLYWARSRVLEYLNQVQGRLPAGAKASLGPDATGVGWVYEYALVDRTGKSDLAQLRALQDWFLKYELKSVPNVAEVATVGGMVRQYQVVVDPARLRAYNLPLAKVIAAIRDANRESGGSVVELAEAEYMVRVRGYLKTLDDFRATPVVVSEGGTPVLLQDVARVQVGPEMRRGIAELDGEGEVAGGIVVLRSGKNAWETIQAVKAKLEQLKPGLPPGVEIVPVYDRSALIERAVDHLRGKLVEEFAVVALVCVVFLLHLRSALVAVVSLPLGVLAAFIVMRVQGVNANIMSLGGIAIAIGAMVDAAIVMIENAHKKLEAWKHAHANANVVEGRETHARALGGRALADHHRRLGRGRARALREPPRHHFVVRSGIRPGGAGRTDVRAARVHQVLRDGGGGGPRRDAGSGADGIFRARAHPDGKRESAEPFSDRRLPPGARRGAVVAEDHTCHRRRGPGRDRLAGDAAGRRIHAAARRR